MRRALKRAGGALLAGALGMTPATMWALEPSGLTGYTPAAAVRNTGPLSEGAARLDEIKVELALLADPATFGCELAAHLTGDGLELRGYVPNEAVREQALKLAREQSALNVVDLLKIHDHLALRSPNGSIDEMRQSAAAGLADVLGKQAEEADCKVRAGGQVVLSGVAGSHEEMLRLSKRMRQVQGCMCVVNRMTVKPVICDGKTFEQVTADGLLTVPVRPTSHVAPTRGVVPARMDTRAWTPYATPNAGSAQTASGPQAAPQSEYRPPTQTAVKTPLPPSYALPAAQNTYAPAPSAYSRVEAPRPAATPTKAHTAGESYVTTGVVTFTDEEPASLVSPHSAAPATPKPTTPKATAPTGVVQTSATVTHAKSTSLSMASMASLKKSIEATCGAAGKDVTVAQTVGNSLEVHIKVRNNEDANHLGTKIMAMPELMPYQVLLKAEIMQ
jgi:osmotically-inducible protein OsmY